MSNSEQQLFNACSSEPSLIFSLIKHGHYEVIESLVRENLVNVNLVDSVGNDVVTRLLKARQYDLVILLMKKRNWDVNHQNENGNTFAHILAYDNSVSALRVLKALRKKTNYLPNIRNNKGETALDRAINNKYLFTAFKLLEDKRFNNINMDSFKNLFKVIIKDNGYGKYSKINNLEIVVENLEKKELDPLLTNLVEKISDNMEAIKRDIMNNSSYLLETIIDNHLVME